MFDIGWQELFIVGLVAVIVIGPKDLPRVLRAVTLGIRKVRSMARDFQEGIDELAREADLQDLRKEIEQGVGGDLQKEIETIGDPTRDVEESVREIGGALEPLPKPRPSPAAAENPAAQPARNSPEDKKSGGDS